jgi:hypothetical protein
MDTNRFFGFLWRVNAILVTCALITVIGRFLYFDVYQQLYRSPRTAVSANVETYRTDESGETIVEAKWRYGDLREVRGASSLLVPFYSVWTTQDPSARPSLRNVLFIDADLSGSRWLLPNNQMEICSYDLLALDDEEEVLAILYEVSEENPEKVNATCTTGTSIYLSRPDGSELTKAIAGVDRQIGHALTDETHVVISYIKDGTVHSALVALSDLAVAQSMTSPPVK